MKITTVTALLAGLVGGLLVVVGVLSLHLLPKPGVGTPPVLKPVAASSPTASENTCSYENMPASPVLPANITEPGAGGKFTWTSEGKPYYCVMHENNFKYNHKSTGCPMAAIFTQDEDGDFTTYTFRYNNHLAAVIHLPHSMVVNDGFYYAFNHSPYKPEYRPIGDIPKSASDLLYILTEGYPLDRTACDMMN